MQAITGPSVRHAVWNRPWAACWSTVARMLRNDACLLIEDRLVRGVTRRSEGGVCQGVLADDPSLTAK